MVPADNGQSLIMVGVALLFLLISVVSGQSCGPGLTLTFAKVPNMVPRTAYPPVLLYAQAPGVAITATCYNRCRESANCDGFIVDYKVGACYRVNIGRQYEDFQVQPSVNFFRKVCLHVPRGCAESAWPVEYIPGYKLLAEQHTVLPNVADKWQCAQLCLNQSSSVEQSCRSVQYQAWSRTCTLSQYDRHTNPEAFLPTVQTEREFEYIENQCPIFSGYNYGPGISAGNEEFCWHDPVYNKTSMRPDLEIDNLTQSQCEYKCQTEMSFRCYAYTYQCPAYGNLISRCLLHSDQVQAGLAHLSSLPCTVYRERISCLDVSVTCTTEAMTVTLREKSFPGQLFVADHAAECSASAQGQDTVQLVIPLPQSSYAANKCDVQVVRSIGSQNRTVASTVVVIQRHKLIQTVSDRVVKVSCYLDQNSRPSAPYNNLTLNASFYVANPVPVQNVIEGHGGDNNATYPPSAVIRVVDGRGGAVSQTQLGDELELQIFVSPPYNVSMIRAGHLIASSGSGQDSLLLLDWRGCPPDPSTFPALSPNNNTSLVARFRAFKFPDSNVLRFSVILTFCVSVCQPTDCGNGMTSYGKRRRRAADVLRSQDNVMEEVPLQLEIIVKTPTNRNESDPIPQISVEDSSDNEPAQTGRSGPKSEVVCATLGSTLLLALAWVALQILLLIGCCVTLGRRERRRSDRVRLETDFQPKHVTWGDANLGYSSDTSPRPSAVRS